MAGKAELRPSSFAVRPVAGGVILRVHVVPRAARSEAAGLHGGALRVRLDAPPVEGAANAALIEFLAGRLGVPRRQVSIVGGLTSREKQVRVEGVEAGAVRRAFGL